MKIPGLVEPEKFVKPCKEKAFTRRDSNSALGIKCATPALPCGSPRADKEGAFQDADETRLRRDLNLRPAVGPARGLPALIKIRE
jgi:hypothetical protein